MDALASTTQTAGTPIAVTVHAFDVYGNGKNDYTSGASLGSATLGNAPGPFQPAPVYGAITWLNGNGTGNVTPKKREDSQNQTVNVTDPQGPGTGDDIVATSTTFSGQARRRCTRRLLAGPTVAQHKDGNAGLQHLPTVLRRHESAAMRLDDSGDQPVHGRQGFWASRYMGIES